jgi:hypothetical protein
MANIATLQSPPAVRIRSNWWALPVLMAGTVMIILDLLISWCAARKVPLAV